MNISVSDKGNFPSQRSSKSHVQEVKHPEYKTRTPFFPPNKYLNLLLDVYFDLVYCDSTYFENAHLEHFSSV